MSNMCVVPKHARASQCSCPNCNAHVRATRAAHALRKSSAGTDDFLAGHSLPHNNQLQPPIAAAASLYYMWFWVLCGWDVAATTGFIVMVQFTLQESPKRKYLVQLHLQFWARCTTGPGTITLMAAKHIPSATQQAHPLPDCCCWGDPTGGWEVGPQ